VPNSDNDNPSLGVELSEADNVSDTSLSPTQITASSNKEAISIQTEDDISLDITFEEDVSPSSSYQEEGNLLLNDSSFHSGSDFSQLQPSPFSGGGIELSTDKPKIEDKPATIIGRLRRTTAIPGTLDPMPLTVFERVGYLFNSVIAIGALGLMLLGLTVHLTGGTIDYRSNTLQEFKNRLIGNGLDVIIRDGVSLVSARSILYPIKKDGGEQESALVIFGEIKNTTGKLSSPLSLKLNLGNTPSDAIKQTIPIGFSLEAAELNSLNKKEDMRILINQFSENANAGRLDANSTARYSFVVLTPPKEAQSWPYTISIEPYSQKTVNPTPKASSPPPKLKATPTKKIKKKKKKKRRRRKRSEKNSSN